MDMYLDGSDSPSFLHFLLGLRQVWAEESSAYRLCVPHQSLADGLASGAETVFYALVALAQAAGDLADLHAAIDVQAIYLATVLGHSGQAALQLCGYLTDT